MSYIVICGESGGATGVRRFAVINRGAVVHFKTIEEAARESSRLNRKAQQHPATVIRQYWIEAERDNSS